MFIPPRILLILISVDFCDLSRDESNLIITNLLKFSEMQSSSQEVRVKACLICLLVSKA